MTMPHHPASVGAPLSPSSDPSQPMVAPAAIAPRPRLASTDILRGHVEVEIDHDGTLYRLRVTSLGKLILTK